MNKDRQIVSELHNFSRKVAVDSVYRDNERTGNHKHHRKADGFRKETQLQVHLCPGHPNDDPLPILLCQECCKLCRQFAAVSL